MAHHVLHILGTAQPEGTGIAKIVSALAGGLDPERYSTHALFLGGHGPLMRVLEERGAHVSGIEWLGGARDVVGAWRFWSHLRGQRFEIVHVHFGGRSVYRLARAATKGKIVLHLHGMVAESHGLRSMAPPGRGVDAVIAVSRDVAEWAEGSNARVIYSGVDVPDAEASGWVLPHSVSGNVLGTAGRLAKVKGIVDLIHALAVLRPEIPGVRLEIAGSGPERVSLEAEVRKLGMEDSVRFLGWCADIQPVFAGWDIFVQPSLGEGLPIATLEAMAAGLPVVATAVGGFREVVESGTTGWLVPPKDRDALVGRLRALLLDPARRHAMGAAGRARVLERFSANEMTSRISEVYDDLVGR
jgi:glycosyltransferase involved in cell wall biosynthesis